MRLIQANTSSWSWLTNPCRCSSDGNPTKLITEIHARLPADGVSSTAGSAGSPAPPSSGSLTIAARRVSARSAAILVAVLSWLTPSGSSASTSTNPDRLRASVRA
jgi:hypothetical protein